MCSGSSASTRSATVASMGSGENVGTATPSSPWSGVEAAPTAIDSAATIACGTRTARPRIGVGSFALLSRGSTRTRNEAPGPRQIPRIRLAVHRKQMTLLVARLDVHEHDVHDRHDEHDRCRNDDRRTNQKQHLESVNGVSAVREAAGGSPSSAFNTLTFLAGGAAAPVPQVYFIERPGFGETCCRILASSYRLDT